MKRSEAIKDIVKKSYIARAKALNEAKGDRKMTQATDAPTAPSATAAAATSSAPAAGAASGSTGGGGGNSTSTVSIRTLTKLKTVLKKGDYFLLTPKEAGLPRLPPEVIVVLANNEVSEEEAKAAEADLAAHKQFLLEAVEDSEVEIEGEHDYEQLIIKQPIFEGQELKDVVVMHTDGEKEVIEVADPSAPKKADEAFNVYKADVANPSMDEITIVKDNNPIIKEKK